MTRTKILVVDDEAGVRNLLDTVLRRRGHDTILADCGRKGTEVFRQERPQVTVLDLGLPDIDGITVLRQLRAIDSLAAVIILTGGERRRLRTRLERSASANF